MCDHSEEKNKMNKRNFFWYHLSHGAFELVDLPKSEKLRLINLILHSTTADMILRRRDDAFEKNEKARKFFSDKLS